MFQHILVIVLSLFFLCSVWFLYKGWVGRKAGLLWAVVWLGALVAVHWPSFTTEVANALNIGRGADLILYCGIIGMLVGFWVLYVRLRRMRREITLLARHIAISEAEQTLTEKPGSAAHP